MEIIKLFDKSNLTFQNPKDVYFNCFVDLSHDKVLNGEQTLQFIVPFQRIGNGSGIQVEDFVEYDNQYFVVKRFEAVRDDNGRYVSIYCEGAYSLLLNKIITPTDPFAETLDTELYGVDIETVLNRIVKDTPFTVGPCDNFGTWDIDLIDKNALEAINEVAANWGTNTGIKPELIFNKFTVSAKTQRGVDNGVQIKYNSNLETITKKEDSESLITRLKGRGKDGMTIEGLDVTGFTAEQLVGFHVENNIITKDYVDAETINLYAIPNEGIKEYDVDDQKILMDKMRNDIKEMCIPEISYDVSFVELSRQGINFTSIDIGDYVNLIDNDMNINQKLRVVEITKNPITLDVSSVTLASRQKSIVDYLAELKATKNTVVVNTNISNTRLDALELAINNATQILNGTNSKIIFDNEKILCIQTNTLGAGDSIQNTTKMLKIANGAIGISVDGGANYRTAMTPDGVVADAIIGNLIMGKLGDFKNVIVKDEDDIEVIRIGQFTSKIDNTIKYGLQIDSGALEITGGLKSDNIDPAVFGSIESQINGLNNAFINLQNDVFSVTGDGKLTATEAQILKKDLLQLQAESTDIINQANELGITTNKTNYQNALTALSNVLYANYIDKSNYPIIITEIQRTTLNGYFVTVESTKSTLLGQIKEDYLTQNAMSQTGVYNGVQVNSTVGFRATSSNNKYRSTMNATQGLYYEKSNDNGSNWTKTLYVDPNDGELYAQGLNAESLKITNNGNVVLDASNGILDLTKIQTIIGQLAAQNIETDNLHVNSINIDGKISVDQLSTNYLNAQDANIVNQTVSRLTTTDEDLDNNTDTQHYIDVHGNTFDYITSTRKKDNNGNYLPDVQMKDSEGHNLYYTDATSTTMTTNVTAYPVMVHQYTKVIKLRQYFSVDPDNIANSTTQIPIIELGAGNGVGNNAKGYIYKGTQGLYFKYITSDGHDYSIVIDDNGIHFNGPVNNLNVVPVAKFQ